MSGVPNDRKLFKWLAILIVLPLVIAIFGGDRFRYPCQDPNNWEKDFCKKPLCDVTRTCPEHVFKGQRDPRLGPPSDQLPQGTQPVPAQGVNCGR
jgi:hypothetical protein